MNTVSIMNHKMNTLVLQLVLLVKSYLPTVKREEGQGMVEYALIIALISIAAITVIGLLGAPIAAAFQSVLNAF